VIGRVLCTRWRHDSPCYPCLSETLDVFYIKMVARTRLNVTLKLKWPVCCIKFGNFVP